MIGCRERGFAPVFVLRKRRSKLPLNTETGRFVRFPCRVVKDVAQATDPTVRKPVGITQTIESRIPGLTSKVPAVIDIAGKPVQRPTSSLGGSNPFPVSQSNNDPVLNELAQLGISTPQAAATVKRRGRVTPLSDSQRQRLTQEENQAVYKVLSRIVPGKGWQSLSDDSKRKQIAKIRKEVDEQRPARIVRMQNQ